MASCAKLELPINPQNWISCTRLDHAFYLSTYRPWFNLANKFWITWNFLLWGFCSHSQQSGASSLYLLPPTWFSSSSITFLREWGGRRWLCSFLTATLVASDEAFALYSPLLCCWHWQNVILLYQLKMLFFFNSNFARSMACRTLLHSWYCGKMLFFFNSNLV